MGRVVVVVVVCLWHDESAVCAVCVQDADSDKEGGEHEHGPENDEDNECPTKWGE